MSKPKVVVAMSGGVDSSVAAGLLCRAGYDVVGITMRLYTEERDDLPEANRTCCGVEAVDDAQAVANVLGIPHYLMNFEHAFQTHVIDAFVSEYARGRTPIPCLACNQYLKFDLLLQKALALGADYVATGHYAQVAQRGGAYHLLKGADRWKDQSYFLYTLGQAELARTLLPVGGMTKDETRRAAAELGLPVADKAESQEICFIPDNDYRRFVAERLNAEPGDLVDATGRTVGRHTGITNYTVGQRHGLGIASPVPLYVTAIDVAANRVVVGAADELLGTRLLVENVSFVQGWPAGPLPVTAKIRYRSPEAAATLLPLAGGMAELRFAEPQRAITPGQAAVFYAGDSVIGGGTIAQRLPDA